MISLPRPARLFLPVLAAAAAAVAFGAATAPTASADATPVTVWLNEQTGVLSITGTENNNDNAIVTKLPSANAPGGYVLVVELKNWYSANFSANCTESGGQGNWNVTCPALNAKRITFEGKGWHDGFINNTSLPSEAHGGWGLDDFRGGPGPDVFYGDGDNDFLVGNGGDDIIDGGAGTDAIGGGSGTDIASWADATSEVTASLDGVANDGTVGENENIVAGDVEGLQGGASNDKLSGSVRDDTLRGGDGADDLEGWNGNDLLRGEAGNDTVHPYSGADVLDGGADTDTLSYAAVGQSVYVYQDGAANDGMLGEQDNVTSIEHLTGSANGDDLQGTTGDDVVHGGGGFDKIDALFGDDTVYGDGGPDNIIGGPGMPADCGNAGCTKFDTDTVHGGAGSDTIDYSSRGDNLTIALDGSRKSGGSMENDTLNGIENANGGDGNDTIYGNDAPNSLTGRGGTDGIVGGTGNDYLSGGTGNDYLDGGENDDYVEGGDDQDTLIGIGGNDTLYGGNGRDRVSYLGASTGVTAHIGTGTSGPTGETDTIKNDVEDLDGTIYGDKLYGNGAANLLAGYGGGDTLVGNGGTDTLQGGGGPDTLNTKGDALQDHSDCGNGTDIANADKIDAVNANCETINKT